jgi:predicted short-subunit dehydrogenase-like oxidoreductase (DUF2520 family)
LRSFADPRTAAAQFAGTACAIDGDAEASKRLARFVRAIGGEALRVKPGRKVLYHAGAVFGSNYLVTVLGAALSLFDTAGIRRPKALRTLVTLAEGTLNNIRTVGIPGALTGPIERGDRDTVERQARAIHAHQSELWPAFAVLGEMTVGLAERKGSLDAERASSLLGALRGNLERLR